MGRKEKHGKGDGSLYRLRPGVWVASIMINGKRHTKTIHAPDESTAEMYRREFVLPFRAQSAQERARILWSQTQGTIKEIEEEEYRLCDFDIEMLEEKYLAHIDTQKMAKATKEALHYNVRYFVEWCKENHYEKIHMIDRKIANKFLSYMQEKKTPSVYNAILITLRKVWKRLEEDHKLNDIWNGHKLKQYETTTKRNLTKEEIFRLLKTLDTKDIETKCFWFLGLYTGMRKSDACMITWDNVDFEKNIISYKPIKTKKHKTIASVSIHNNLLVILKEIKSKSLDDVYVLPTFARLDKASSKVRIRKIFKEANIEVKNDEGKVEVGYHSLRHGFISMMLDSGVPVTSIADMIGHQKKNAYKMTLGYHNTNTESDINKNSINNINFNEEKKEIKEDNNSELERLRKENAELKERLAKIKELFNI